MSCAAGGAILLKINVVHIKKHQFQVNRFTVIVSILEKVWPDYIVRPICLMKKWTFLTSKL